MSWLNSGSLAATNGNNAFVGTSTLMLGAFVGDAVVYQNGTTFWAAEIASITDNTHFATAENWPFSSGTVPNGEWSVLPCSPLRQTVATTNAQLATIIAQFSSVLSLSASDNYCTFNKAAAGNNNGMYLTTGGAARGRVGTFGDDNLRLSVANGGGYTDAMVITYTTGLATVVGDPTAALGIATKQYVDGSSNAKVVRAASTTNINIASPGTGIGGVTPAANERYLLAGQTTASQNGLYIYNTSTSAMTRCTDADAVNELQPGCLVMATEGTYASKVFMLVTAAPLAIGTTNLTFSRLDTLNFASPTFTGTMTMPDSATWASTGIANLAALGIGMSPTPTNILGITQNQNSYSRVSILNNSATANAQAGFRAASAAHTADFQILGDSFTTSGPFVAGYGLISASLGLTVQAATGPIIFVANGSSENGRFDNNGSLLLGTTTAGVGIGFTSQIAVSGGISRDAAVFHTATAGNEQIDCWSQTTSGTANFVNFWTENTPTSRGSIQYNRAGGVVAYNTSSDARLKTNIADAGDAGSIIDALRVRQYDWIDSGIHTDFGFVAQEEYPVYPSAVCPGDDDPKTIHEQWGRDDSKLVPLLVKEAQSLRARVAALEAKAA